jgi:hypothetical protein
MSPDKVTYKGLISSLMLDISLQVNQTELISVYEKHNSGRTQIAVDAMKAIAFKLLKKMSEHAYILIDAMDECQVQDQHLVTAFIKDLLQLGSGINIFVTC